MREGEGLAERLGQGVVEGHARLTADQHLLFCMGVVVVGKRVGAYGRRPVDR